MLMNYFLNKHNFHPQHPHKFNHNIIVDVGHTSMVIWPTNPPRHSVIVVKKLAAVRKVLSCCGIVSDVK